MTNELSHHGILGMKWGIRRYQNADGSLTSAGKRRYGTVENFKKVQSAKKAASPSAIKAKKAREKAEENTRKEIEKYNKKLGTKKETETVKTKEETKPTKKKLSELSDDELKERINRLQAEKNYLSLQSEVSKLQPKQISKGKKFINGIGDVVIPALKESSKSLLTDYFKKKGKDLLGLEEPSDYEKLKKEVDILNLQKQKKEYIDAIKGSSKLKKEVDELNLKKQKKEYEDFLKGDKTLQQQAADAKTKMQLEQARQWLEKNKKK